MDNTDSTEELEQLEKNLDELQETIDEVFGTDDDVVAKAADEDGNPISESELGALEAEVADLESSLNSAVTKVAMQTWDARVARIAAEENVPTTVAMQKARVQHPEAFELLQKSTPAPSNRIMGYEPSPEKARAVRSEFISAVKEIARNGNFSRIDAFRKAREMHPELFAAFQRGE